MLNKTDLSRADLNLLALFEVVLEERHVGRAADRLRRDLVRVHPSFRFEERLATRLAEAAVAVRMPVAAGEGRLVAFRGSSPGDPAATDPGLEDVGMDAGSVSTARRQTGRPLIIGGALTSAALSIAGAALVAWRLGRPSRQASPMARAARAVREAKLDRVRLD